MSRLPRLDTYTSIFHLPYSFFLCFAVENASQSPPPPHTHTHTRRSVRPPVSFRAACTTHAGRPIRGQSIVVALCPFCNGTSNGTLKRRSRVIIRGADNNSCLLHLRMTKASENFGRIRSFLALHAFVRAVRSRRRSLQSNSQLE